MDLYMPDVDGMELTALIREREAFISTPIVFLSGEHDADKHFEALNAGGDDFLSKPIRPKHLISAVTNRVRRARQMSSRQQPAPVAARRRRADGTVARDALLRRLAECLAMEDARTPRRRARRVRARGCGDVARAPRRCALRAALRRDRRASSPATPVRTTWSRATATRVSCCSIPIAKARSSSAYASNIRDRLSRETFAAAEGAAQLLLDAGVCPFQGSVGDALAMLEAAKAADREGARRAASTACSSCATRRRRTTPSSRG